MSQNAVTIEHARDIPPEASGHALTPLDMLNTAVARGADIAILEKLMGLQERYEASQARKAFDAAIAEAKSQIKPVTRTAKGHSGNYADFASIANAVDPILSKHGLSYRFRTAQTEKIISVTCVLSHKDGHSEETTLSGPADTSGSKNIIQSIGSTLTYLQRYSLVQMLGLAAAKDADGENPASHEVVSPKQVEKLREALKFRGGHEQRFLDHIKVDTLENIRADKFEACLQIINGVRK